MAPSIYEYRTAQEWEKAMAEWCAENEPRFFVSYLDETAQPFGAWRRVEVESIEEAHAICIRKDLPQDHPFIIVAPGGRVEDGKILRPCGDNPDDTKVYERYRAGDRPGGTASEYRALGLR